MAIATFASGDVIAGCLDSLRAVTDVELRVVVVDNASPDTTRETIRDWARDNLTHGEFVEGDDAGDAWLTLIAADANRGFAHATNRAIRHLMRDPEIALFWLLNPDCRTTPDAPHRFAEAAKGRHFSLMGGRIVFDDHPDIVQTDGGRVSRLTGRCISVNRDRPCGNAKPPAADTLDYVSGASCVASRAFIDQAGLMAEDYFLYYEEVDWAMQRGDLPLLTVSDAVVRHIGGTSTGSAGRSGAASPFSLWFNYRSRFRFIRRHMPLAWPGAIFWSMGKAASLLVRGRMRESSAILSATFGGAPPREVRERLDQEAIKRVLRD